MREIRVQAVLDNLNTVIDFIDEVLERAECPLRTVMKINLSVEEIFVNIASYAYAPNTGYALIQMQELGDPKRVQITFVDEGVPYDPLAKEDPDITLSAEERQIGGLGIYMVKKSMDNMTYEYKDNKNILTIEKNI